MATWNQIRLYIAIASFIGIVVLLIYVRVLERKLDQASKRSNIDQTAIQILASLLIEAGMAENDLKMILEHELDKQFKKH